MIPANLYMENKGMGLMCSYGSSGVCHFLLGLWSERDAMCFLVFSMCQSLIM